VSDKIITGNSRLVKDLNSNVVLNLIRTKAPVSGAQLAKITKMRPSTIHNILKALEKQKLIVRSGIGDSTRLGGRRPMLWNIRGNSGYVIGIQLEINEIGVVLVDLNSRLIDDQKISTKVYNNLSEIREILNTIVNDILHKHKISKSRLLGIGIGVSGLVDITSGIIIKTSLLPAAEQPIKFEEYLEEYFGVPVYVENDANAAALAEKWFGKAGGIKNIIYILTVVGPTGFGIGFGLILNDQIYRGSHMFAGETELFELNIEKILKTICGCEDSSLKVGNEDIELKELQLDHLVQASHEGNELALRFFNEIGTIVGNEIVKVINMLDPKMVVIGGEILEANSLILGSIQQAVKRRLSNIGNRELEIIRSSNSQFSVALGAATIILKKIFQDPSLDYAISINKEI